MQQMPSVRDLPDSSFMLPSNPARVRTLRLMFRIGAVTSVALGLILVGVTFIDRALPPALALLTIPLSGGAIGEWFLASLIAPQGVKVDAMQVVYGTPLDRRRMVRSDVAVIFRGQRFEQSRAGGSWENSYVFAARDGKVGLSCPAVWFTDDGMQELARRLQVPIEGDFRVRVTDRIEVVTA